MKQWLAAALGAGLLMAGPALAGDPRSGGHGGGGHHPPAPPPPACCHGGGNVNINVNASASASAYASAGGYINAHGYDMGGGGYRGGGGVVYAGGGYGGDAGVGYYGGGPVYAEMPAGCGAPPSAPFGYAVRGMGRDYRDAPAVRPDAGCPGGGTPPSCQSRCDSHGGGGSRYSESYEVYYEERSESGSSWTREDRGGRYGDSRSHEQQDRGGGHRPAPTDGWVSYGCGCVSSGDSRPYGYDHDGEGDHRSDGDHRPPPPHYEPAPPPAQPPHRPRQEYRQEPGERG